MTRWQWVAATTATAGWRIVRNELADLGEITASTESEHACTQPADQRSAAGHGHGGRLPLFCAIDSHGLPQSAYPLSTRSITTIIAARLADRTVPTESASPDEQTATTAVWGADDHARAIAQRKAANDRLADLDDLIDQADAYAEAVLARIDTELAGTTPNPAMPVSSRHWA